MTSARPDTWMPFYVGDYLKDTGRLTTEGHGAYLLLILDYWSSGQALPNDDDELSAITRLHIDRWKELRPKIARFFTIKKGKWHHKRIDRELLKALKITSERSGAGKKGAKSRWQKNGSAIVLPLANPLQTDGPLPLPLPSPLPETTIESLPLEAKNGRMKHIGSVNGVAEKWSTQSARDDYAVQQIVPHLPGKDDGEKWAIAMAAEDIGSVGHQQACRVMRDTAKTLSIGWISPERRKQQ